jgi:SAM-dependent methyltransferase
MLKNKKISGYQRAFYKYGVDVRALQWISRRAQELRFNELVVDIDFEDHRPIGPLARRGKTVLDVGCGFGDIIPFIEAKTRSFNYIGCDLVPEFIEVAKGKYSNRKFEVADYFGNPFETKYDIVLTSGTLNANITNPYEYRYGAIRTMFDHAKELIAFNMAGGQPEPKNKQGNRVYYADLNKIVNFCKTLAKKIKVRKDYSPNDFTVIMFK